MFRKDEISSLARNENPAVRTAPHTLLSQADGLFRILAQNRKVLLGRCGQREDVTTAGAFRKVKQERSFSFLLSLSGRFGRRRGARSRRRCSGGFLLLRLGRACRQTG